MLFISPQKLFRSQDLYDFVLTFWFVEKRLNLKDKVNFKIYDAITWLTNNCNTHIDQYFKK